MLTSLELTVLLLAVATIIFLKHYKIRRTDPPGPLGLPFLGMLPHRLIELLLVRWKEEIPDLERFREYKEKYGDIWSENVGNLRMITFTTWELINEAFIDNAELFSGRPSNDVFMNLSGGSGIIFANGEVWKENRTSVIRSLKELGMGKKEMENKVCDEGDDLIAYLKKSDRKNIVLSEVFLTGIMNVIMRLVFDEKGDFDDPDLKRYVEDLNCLFHGESASLKLTMFPTLFKFKMIQNLFPDVRRFLNANRYCIDFIERKCLLRDENNRGNISPTCVYDYFCKLNSNNCANVTYEKRKKEVVLSMFDLFSAGIDTSTNMMSFGCLMLGKHDDVQLELRDEMRRLVENSGQITLALRKQCPKFMSFLDEVHRFCVLVPKFHRRVLQRCTFHGYEIYPDDIIFADAAHIYSDPNIFPEPEKFNSYRFLDESRSKYVPSKYLIPFGIGKRSCLGESIATMKIFLILEKIIFNFRIILTMETLRNFDSIMIGHPGIVHSPRKHTMTLELL